MTADALRFDGQVAIVTGAGGAFNLGRAYAIELGRRGAAVVVNDISDGADAVVEEIVTGGGQAVADHGSVAIEDEANGVVDHALEEFGRVDILVNNAGTSIFADFDEMTSRDVRRVIDSHLYGAIWMTRAVWPHLRGQGYGRIVNALSVIGSKRLYYGTARGGLAELTYGLALEGHPLGIRTNGIYPLAGTDLMERSQVDGPSKEMLRAMKPELVAPVVAVLAHERCPVNGESLFAAGGMVSIMGGGRPREGDPDGLPGVPGGMPAYMNPEITAEDALARWDDIVGPEHRPYAFAPEPLSFVPYSPT